MPQAHRHPALTRSSVGFPHLFPSSSPGTFYLDRNERFAATTAGRKGLQRATSDSSASDGGAWTDGYGEAYGETIAPVSGLSRPTQKAAGGGGGGNGWRGRFGGGGGGDRSLDSGYCPLASSGGGGNCGNGGGGRLPRVSEHTAWYPGKLVRLPPPRGGKPEPPPDTRRGKRDGGGNRGGLFGLWPVGLLGRTASNASVALTDDDDDDEGHGRLSGIVRDFDERNTSEDFDNDPDAREYEGGCDGGCGGGGGGAGVESNINFGGTGFGLFDPRRPCGGGGGGGGGGGREREGGGGGGGSCGGGSCERTGGLRLDPWLEDARDEHNEHLAMALWPPERLAAYDRAKQQKKVERAAGDGGRHLEQKAAKSRMGRGWGF